MEKTLEEARTDAVGQGEGWWEVGPENWLHRWRKVDGFRRYLSGKPMGSGEALDKRVNDVYQRAQGKS